jgi:hypothetical protein
MINKLQPIAKIPPLAEEQGNKVGFGFIGFRFNVYEF